MHQLWIIALWLSRLKLIVFLKIIWVFWLEHVISFLGNTFWMSLTVFGLFFMATLGSGNQRFWSNQTIKNQTIKNFITDHRSLEMNTKHVRRHRQTLARKAQWTKEPPTPTKASTGGGGGGSLVLINDHRSVNKNSGVLLKMLLCTRLKYDSVSGKMRQVLLKHSSL